MPAGDTHLSTLGQITDRAKWEFALPDGARRLIAAGDLAGRDNEALIHWLSSDELLSERLLSWCNTPLFNVAKPYQSLDDALRMMDATELSRLALLAFVRGMFTSATPPAGLNTERLWSHSIAVASAAAMISRTCGKGDPSLAFVAGALHDIGLCASQSLVPQAMQSVLSLVDQLSPTHEVELEQQGWDHTELGAAILDGWGMPEPVVAAARHHHSADEVTEQAWGATVGCVAVANFLCSRCGWSSIGVHNLPPPSQRVLRCLGIHSGLLSVIWQQLAGSLEAVEQIR